MTIVPGERLEPLLRRGRIDAEEVRQVVADLIHHVMRLVFGAAGARIITTVRNELQRAGQQDYRLRRGWVVGQFDPLPAGGGGDGAEKE